MRHIQSRRDLSSLLILTLTLATSSPRSTADLLWYSPMDGNADAVVGNDGIPNDTPSPAPDRDGNPGAAVEFDGIDEYYDLGDFGSFSAASMSVWVLKDSSGGESGAFCAGQSGGGSSVYFSMMDDNSGSIRVDLDDGDARRYAISPSGISVGQWYHVATTWTAEQSLRIFIDGIRVKSTGLSGVDDPYDMTFNGLIGSERTGERFWDGKIDDAGLWDEELSSRRVAAIHGLGRFHGLGLNDPAIDTVVAFNTLGQTIVIDGTTWEYVDGLSGASGTIDGSIAGGDAMIVLDGLTDRGIQVDPVTPPAIANHAATNVVAVSANIGGEVTDAGGEDPNVTIYWGDNDGGTNPGVWDTPIDLGIRSGSFTTPLSNLNPSTTYYFRCLASNSADDVWAPSTFSFTTPALADAPAVINTPATDVSYTDATVGGQVTDTGGEEPTVTIYWGSSDGGDDPNAWEGFKDLSTQSGAFDVGLSNLDDGGVYFFRCFASNSGGPAWAASSETFSTVAYSLAGLTNFAATEITGVSARINGSVASTGGDSPAVEIHYGTVDGGTTAGAWQHSVNIGTRAGDYSTLLGSLAPNSTYYFTASGQNVAGVAWATPSLSFSTPAVPDLLINEFMASNDGGTPVPGQVPGTSDDWIEIHNRGTTTLSLAGWHLTDSAGSLAKWTFPPETEIASGGFLVVFASGDNSPDANGNLHTNFKLSADGEYVALSDPALTVVSEFGPAGSDYPAQESDISYGLHPSTLNSVFFAVPTPGAANDAGGQLPVAAASLSHERGYYSAPIDVVITSDTPDATIRYTLDGTEPTETTNGSSYSTPISISSTTVLRARAYKSGFSPTDINTQSYVFPADIVTQTQPPGYPSSWGDEPNADYDVDTGISQSTEYSARFLEGLRDLPTLSVAGHQDDFFGPDGIYVETQDRSLEAPVSAEYFHPDATADGVNIEEGFQIDCGCKLQGGASRIPSRSIKHSFSLRFRDIYGAGKLDYPVFDGTEVTSFDSIHLRAMYNNSWIHSNADQRARATMIRDQWARDCMIAMGNADGGQGHYVHLYINGIYWGVFNLHERLENDHYAEYHDYDSDTVVGYNPEPDRQTAEETASFEAMEAVVTDPTSSWSEIQAVLDVDNYIDYVIVQNFGRNADLKWNGNWRAAGGGTAEALWRFYVWDTERILEDETDTSPLTNSGGSDGALIFNDLEKHREFRVLFADRAYKALFNAGALTNLPNRDRFIQYTAEIDSAIVCESARWGDDRSGGAFNGRYARDENWTSAVDGNPSGLIYSPYSGVLGSWFPESETNNRSLTIIDDWRTRTFTGTTDTFLGTIDAPVFTVNGSEQHGGEIPPGGSLAATTTTGAIYYTTDGSDPRLEGGGIAPGAMLLSGSMTLPASGLVRMRVLDGGGDSWSPLNEAYFYLEPLAGASDLRVTEINYNALPADALEAEAGAGLTVPREFSGGDFEFIEIRNVGPAAVNLDGVRFTAGIDFSFPAFTIPAGGHAVVVEDVEAFEIRYGTGLPVAGAYSGALDNDGERIALVTWDGTTIQDFTFNDAGSWPGRADGNGSSLEIIDPAGSYVDSENWRSSCEFHGSPGVAGVGSDGRIVINEVASHTDLPAIDTIELHNTTGSTVSVANWLLSDSAGNYRKFRITAGEIPGDGYQLWSEDDFNFDEALAINSYEGTASAPPTTVTTAAHGLATGDVITISGYGGIGDYNGSFEVTVIDATRFTIPVTYLDNDATTGSYTGGEPFALSSSGDDVWLLEGDAGGRPVKFIDHIDFAAAFNGETLGRWPNGAGTDTLISMTADTLGGANSGPVIGPVILSEVMYHPNATIEDDLEYVEICNTGSLAENLANWRLRGGVDFDFTAAHEIAPGGLLVMVAFDPAVDVSVANSFRSTYGIDSSIVLLGPWTDGPLRNDSGTVRLQRPDTPPLDDPTNYPQVTEDEVIYFNTSPWPEGADGNGQSLNRTGIEAFGNFATSWHGDIPSPGGLLLDYGFYRDLTFGPGMPPGSGPLEDFDGDGIDNQMEYALGLDPLVPGPIDVIAGGIENGDFTFTYPQDTLLTDVVYQVEVSDDLVDWDPVADEFVSSTNYQEIRRASVTMADESQLFFRLVVTLD